MTEKQLYKECDDKALCVHAAVLFLPLQEDKQTDVTAEEHYFASMPGH